MPYSKWQCSPVVCRCLAACKLHKLRLDIWWCTGSEVILSAESAMIYGLGFDLFSLSVSHGEEIVFFSTLAGKLRQLQEYLDWFDVSDCVYHHASWSFRSQGEIDGRCDGNYQRKGNKILCSRSHVFVW